MGQHRRASSAVIGAALLAGGMAIGALGTAGTSGATVPRGAHVVAATTERLAVNATIVLQGQHLGVSLTGVAGPTSADLHVVAAGTAVELRRIGSTVYLHLPPGTKTGLPAGKTWGSVSLAAVSKQIGIPLPGLSPSGQAGGLGPGQLLSDLAKASSSPPRKVGTATIHSIPTTAYQLHLDVAKLLGGAGAAKSAVLKQLLGPARSLTSVPTTVWADPQGRLVQLHVAVPLTLGFAGVRIHASVNVLAQGWDFGVPVHVSPPPASLVAPLPPSALSAGAGLNALGGLAG